MLHRFILASVIAAAGSGIAAQTPVPVQVTAEQRNEIQKFESSLRAAIATAGRRLADRARQAVPDIQLQFEAEARIVGVLLPEGEGLQFSVDVPGVEPSTARLWELSRLLSNKPSDNFSRVNGGGGSTGSTPTAPAAPSTDSVLMTNPIMEYSTFTHDAMVDAMLDNAFALPLKEGQKLTLIVGNNRVGLPVNPLAQPDKLLYLRVTAEDLLALRQNRISRDEAKKRILEWRY